MEIATFFISRSSELYFPSLASISIHIVPVVSVSSRCDKWTEQCDLSQLSITETPSPWTRNTTSDETPNTLKLHKTWTLIADELFLWHIKVFYCVHDNQLFKCRRTNISYMDIYAGPLMWCILFFMMICSTSYLQKLLSWNWSINQPYRVTHMNHMS